MCKYLLMNELILGREERRKVKAHIFLCKQFFDFSIKSGMFCAYGIKRWMNFLKNFSIVVADAGQQYAFSDWQLQHSNSVSYNTNITLNLSRIDVVSFPLLAFLSYIAQSV